MAERPKPAEPTVEISWVTPSTGQRNVLRLTDDQAAQWWSMASQPLRETFAIRPIQEVA